MFTVGQAIAACKDQMTATLRSQHTARAYKKGLDVFASYLLTEHRVSDDQPVSALDIDKFIAFPVWVLRQSSRPTALVRVSAVKYFLDDWLIQKRLIEPSYADGMRLHNAIGDVTHKSKNLPKRLASAEDVERMIETARALCDIIGGLGSRMRLAMVSLMATSGIRVEELTNLNCKDVDLKKKEVFIRSGKENKDRIVPIAEGTAQDIAAYWTARGWHLRDDPAFANHGQKTNPKEKARLSTSRARRLVEGLERMAGIDGHVTPHSFRHYFATRVLRETRNIELVRRLLGHSDISVTKIYLDLDTTDLHNGHEEAFGDWQKEK